MATLVTLHNDGVKVRSHELADALRVGNARARHQFELEPLPNQPCRARP